MCGISGEVRFDGRPVRRNGLLVMNKVMGSRGPDGEGVTIHGPVGLGHRRLKILDLTAAGDQPMVDEGLGMAIVFNGCVYNFRELRSELEAVGYSFTSTGDTEVVLKAFHHWGAAAVHRFEGMFAFAVHDRRTNVVTLARDRLGIKPLYIAPGTGRLRFASSLPALLAAGEVDTTIDPVALYHYMTFHSVVPDPHTIVNGVRKVPPATVVTVEPTGKMTQQVYWNPTYGPSDDMPDDAVWPELVKASLDAAVQKRMVADVPVGVLLSGGLDSSLIVGLLAEHGQKGLNTFSIGFEAAGGEQGDEFQYSDIIAKHFATDHHKIVIDGARTVSELPAAIAAMNEPMVSHDNIGFFLLSQEVSKHVKVVQSGQGADEVFAGYFWYQQLLNAKDPEADYAKLFRDRDHSEMGEVLSPDYFGEDHGARLIAERFGAPGAERGIDKVLRMDTMTMLVDDPVKRVDSHTMAWGLEARVPFLDHDLVDLAARCPAELKTAQEGKGVLKDVARHVIPHEVIDRPKGYFPVPAIKHMAGPVLEFVQRTLSDPAAKNRGLFQQAYLDKLLAEPADHITPLKGNKLWQIALLESWLQTHNIR